MNVGWGAAEPYIHCQATTFCMSGELWVLYLLYYTSILYNRQLEYNKILFICAIIEVKESEYLILVSQKSADMEVVDIDLSFSKLFLFVMCDLY